MKLASKRPISPRVGEDSSETRGGAGPAARVGDRLQIWWPTEDGGSGSPAAAHLCFQGIVTAVRGSKKKKTDDVPSRHHHPFKYSILFDDGDVRATRLVHLKWSCISGTEQGNSTPALTRPMGRPDKPIPPHSRILAPMVGGSELPFRLLCRKYGADLAYTPMISSVRFAVDEEYRTQQFQTTPADRPLVAHFNGNDPDIIVAAAKYVDCRCDAVDINLGCPQRIAFTGHFGSYLLGEEDRGTVLAMVSALDKALSVPVFVKIRLLDTIDETIRLCKQLVEAGASLIAIHGRYRVNLVGRTGPGARDGPAHLDQIRDVKLALGDFPVISNGNVISWADVVANAEFTGADGIMSAEGILNDPTLFAPGLFNGDLEETRAAGLLPQDKLDVANEYLDLVDKYPVAHSTVLFHVRRMCSEYLEKYQLMVDLMESVDLSNVRTVLATAKSIRDKCLKQGIEFVKDPKKAERVAEAAARRKREEGKRKDFEARMIRKAKRNGKEPDFYLRQGSENPTIDEIEELRAMPREKAFDIWKQKHSQHCFSYHMEAQKCPRERACAFLHSDLALSVLSYG